MTSVAVQKFKNLSSVMLIFLEEDTLTKMKLSMLQLKEIKKE